MTLKNFKKLSKIEPINYQKQFSRKVRKIKAFNTYLSTIFSKNV